MNCLVDDVNAFCVDQLNCDVPELIYLVVLVGGLLSFQALFMLDFPSEYPQSQFV